MKINRLLQLVGVGAGLALGTTPTGAVNWTNAPAGTFGWNANANWDAAFPNASGAVAWLTNNIAGDQVINLNGAITAGQLKLGDADGASTFTIAANGGSLTFNDPSLTTYLSQEAASKGDTIAAPFHVPTGTQVVISNNATANPLTISGVIGGGGLLVYRGPGAVVLSGVNTNTGQTTLAGGTLIATSLSGLGDSASAVRFSGDGVTLKLQNDGAGNNGTIVFGAPNNNAAGYSLTFGNINQTGTVVVDRVSANVGNTVQLNNFSFGVDASQTLVVTGANGYRLKFAGNVTVTSVFGGDSIAPTGVDLLLNTISAPINGRFTLAGTSSGNVVAGAISGATSMTKANSSTWTLAGTSTYSGATAISGGTLAITHTNGGLGDSTTAVAFTGTGATLKLQNDGTGNNGTIVFGAPNNNTAGYSLAFAAGTLTDTVMVDRVSANVGNTIQLNNLTFGGDFDQTLVVNGANGYRLKFAGNVAPTGINAFTTLAPAGADLLLNTISGASNVRFALGGTTSGNVVQGAISGGMGLTKANSSTWTLAGTSTYSGQTTISAGTLAVTNTNGGLGDSTSAVRFSATGATLKLQSDGAGNNGTIVFGAPNNNAAGYSVVIAAGTLTDTVMVDRVSANVGNTVQLNNLTFGGDFSQTLVVTGANGYRLKLAGNVTATGLNAFSTLAPTGADLLLNTVSGTASTRFALDGTSSGNVIAGTLSGGSVTKLNTSTWTLLGNNTFASVLQANGGTVRLGSANALPGGIGVSGGTSALSFNGGVVELGAGDFLRAVGGGANASWAGAGTGNGGGFSAFGGNRVVNLGGASASLLWSTSGFCGNNLMFGSATADSVVDFQNPINFFGNVATIRVDDNPNTSADYAIMSGVLSGGGLTKTGAGRLVMSANNTYAVPTTISAGTLTVNGSIGAGGITVAAGATLGGSGTIGGVVSGAGTVDPGNSPGILTASQVTPTSGLDFNFEFTQAGSIGSPGLPDYNNATASLNDVLRLTNATPFTANLTAANVISLYLGSSPYGTNVFHGGFYTDLPGGGGGDFIGAISNATFAVYVLKPGGGVTYNGLQYDAATVSFFAVRTVNETGLQFSGQDGWITEFEITVIPEPSLGLLLAAGSAVLCGWRRQRRR